MLRRFTAQARAQASTATASPFQASAARSYYYPGTGEVGIWGESMGRVFQFTMFMSYVAGPWFLYKIVIRGYSPDKQWVCMSTDKWYSDGTELKGEEATANLRLQRERIMPIMDKYLEKIEASQQA